MSRLSASATSSAAWRWSRETTDLMRSVHLCMFTVLSLAVCSLLPGSAMAGPAPREEEVAFANGEVRLAGTLLLPHAGKPVPAVVFVHGAAYHDRRDNREEAEYFARRGIAALVYDKRGCGASSGDWATASQFELADDALAAVLLLKGVATSPDSSTQ
jgi:pimeloyl-ACP methyl ester carboxylesterase